MAGSKNEIRPDQRSRTSGHAALVGGDKHAYGAGHIAHGHLGRHGRVQAVHVLPRRRGASAEAAGGAWRRIGIWRRQQKYIRVADAGGPTLVDVFTATLSIERAASNSVAVVDVRDMGDAARNR